MSKAGISHKAVKEELLRNNELKKEYELLAPRYQAVSQLIQARSEANLTQEELARRVGTHKSNISRIEGGNQNLTIDQLSKLATALGKQLTITIQ